MYEFSQIEYDILSQYLYETRKLNETQNQHSGITVNEKIKHTNETSVGLCLRWAI